MSLFLQSNKLLLKYIILNAFFLIRIHINQSIKILAFFISRISVLRKKYVTGLAFHIHLYFYIHFSLLIFIFH